MRRRKNNHFAIELFLDVKFIKDGKIYLAINKKAESLLKQFASALINAMFSLGATCKDVNNTSFTPRTSTASAGTFHFYIGEGSTYIVLSNNTADQTLSFDDYKIQYPLGNLTTHSGFPQYGLETGSDYSQARISDRWTYTGSDTSITASALYYKNVIDTSGSYHPVMLAKDVFNPALNLQQNSLIDWSYIIRVSL
jgi:hypothetical protein